RSYLAGDLPDEWRQPGLTSAHQARADVSGRAERLELERHPVHVAVAFERLQLVDPAAPRRLPQVELVACAVAILDHRARELEAAGDLEEQRRAVIVDVERDFGPAALAGDGHAVGQWRSCPEESEDRGRQPAERHEQRAAACGRRHGRRGRGRGEPEVDGEQQRHERAHENRYRPRYSAAEAPCATSASSPSCFRQVRLPHSQPKIASHARRLATPRAATMPIGAMTGAGPAPSLMIGRSALFPAVNGSAWTSHCMASGKRSAEKKLPESNHIGSMVTFMSPDTASIVRARLAT